MLIYAHEGLYHEGDKAEIAYLILCRTVEKDAGVGGERPVAVLSRAVYSVERLLVEQTAETVMASHLLHQ